MTILLVFILGCVISFLCTAAVVAFLCWCLPILGLVAIGGWVIAFSWKLVALIWVVCFALKLMLGIGGS